MDLDYARREEEEEEQCFVVAEERKRWGGPQNDEEEEEEEGGAEEEMDEEARKNAERERKKAEVRKRLEAVSKAKNAKKGFLTPERKKKLRKLLMLKAAEDLKEKQRQLELERQRILNERIVPMPDLDSGDLESIFEDMKERVLKLEMEHYDINYIVRQKDFEINELTIAVNDLRGKFVKPTLKKVSKTENRFDKLKKKESSKVDFRSNLKVVEKTAGIDEEPEDKKKAEWAK